MSSVTLALCASPEVASCALRCGESAFGPVFTQRGQRDLPAAVELLFREAETRPRDLDRVLLDLGPGSYTGLRVAVTHAGFCRRYLAAEVWTVTSLELAAVATWRAQLADPGVRLRPVLDARRKRFHHALVGVDKDRDVAVLLEQPRATSLGELIAAVQPDEQIVCAEQLWPLLAKGLATSRIEPTRHDAALLFDPWLAPRPAGAGLEPLYLMGSYAEGPTG